MSKYFESDTKQRYIYFNTWNEFSNTFKLIVYSVLNYIVSEIQCFYDFPLLIMKKKSSILLLNIHIGATSDC